MWMARRMGVRFLKTMRDGKMRIGGVGMVGYEGQMWKDGRVGMRASWGC
jgi:hypothetical protein